MKNWIKEDELFAPKRKAENKASRKKTYIIGSFYSYKNNTTVEYQSLNECYFFYLLEIDNDILRYYPQPVEIPLVALSKNGKIHRWVHVPDVLVFRQTQSPYLFQVKESPNNLSNLSSLYHKRSINYARRRGWEYKMIFPKQMPRIVIKNLEFLVTFLRQRDYYSILEPNLIRTMKRLKALTVRQLSEYVPEGYQAPFVYPLIYHLIAKGKLSLDLEKKITLDTRVELNNSQSSNLLDKYITFGGGQIAV